MPSVVQHLVKEYNGTDTLNIATPAVGNTLCIFLGHRSGSQGAPSITFAGQLTPTILRGFKETQPTNSTYRRGTAALSKVADGTETQLTVVGWDGVSNAVEFYEIEGLGDYSDLNFAHTTENTLNENSVDVASGVLAAGVIRVGAGFIKKNGLFPQNMTSCGFNNLTSDATFEDDATNHGLSHGTGWIDDGVAGDKTDTFEYLPANGSRAISAVVMLFTAASAEGVSSTVQLQTSGKGTLRNNVDFGGVIQEDIASVITPYASAVSANWDSTPAIGSLLLVAHYTGNGNSIGPDGYTEALAITNVGSADQAALYWKIADGTEQVVDCASDADDEHGLYIGEFQGPFDASPVDRTASTDPVTLNQIDSGTTLATTQADELAVAFFAARDEQVTGQYNAFSNGFVELADVQMAAKQLGVASKVLDSIGTIQTTATMATSSTAHGGVVTFKKASASSTPVTENNTTQAQSSDLGTLAENATTAPVDSIAAHTSDDVTLSQNNTLTAQGSSHLHASDQIALSQANQVTATGTSHTQSADALALTQASVATSNGSIHAQQSDSLGLTSHNVVAPVGSSHSQDSDSLGIVQSSAVTALGSSSAQSSDSVSLIQESVLECSDTAHTQTVDSVGVTQRHNIQSVGTEHAHSSDSATLLASGTVGIQSSAHNQDSTEPSLTQAHSINAGDTNQSQASGLAGIVGASSIAGVGTGQDHASGAGELSVQARVVAQGSTQQQASGSANTQTAGQIVGGKTTQAQSSSTVSATQLHIIGATDSQQAQATDLAALAQASGLAANDSQHTQTSDLGNTAEILWLVSADSVHTQTADQATLVELQGLGPSDSRHTQQSESLDLTEHSNVVALDSYQAHYSDTTNAINQDSVGLLDEPIRLITEDIPVQVVSGTGPVQVIWNRRIN